MVVSCSWTGVCIAMTRAAIGECTTQTSCFYPQINWKNVPSRVFALASIRTYCTLMQEFCVPNLHALCDIEKPGVVCIAETWLCDHSGKSEASIPGCNCIRCDRNRHGGGIALFISDKLEFQVTMCRPRELEFLLVSVYSTNNESIHWLMVPATC